MFVCEVLVGMLRSFGAPSGSTSSGTPSISSAARARSAMASSKCRVEMYRWPAVAMELGRGWMRVDGVGERRDGVLVAPEVG